MRLACERGPVKEDLPKKAGGRMRVKEYGQSHRIILTAANASAERRNADPHFREYSFGN
jgi:hypothetical protein